MDLQDICSGCSRHVAVCMCSMSIGPDSIVVSNPKPASLADKLRIIAADVAGRKSAAAAKTVADAIRNEAKFAAQEGKFGLLIWLKDKSWSKSDIENAAPELRRDGFEVVIGREVTAWHSNTDWDEEDFVTIKWS